MPNRREPTSGELAGQLADALRELRTVDNDPQAAQRSTDSGGSNVAHARTIVVGANNHITRAIRTVEQVRDQLARKATPAH